MAEIRLEKSDYVRYVLQYEEFSTHKLEGEPEGWEDDDLEIVRNSKYHGILTQFSSGLKFRGYAKDYIKNAYKQTGINTNLYLIKYVLRENINYRTLGLNSPEERVGWEERYRGLADFETMKEQDNTVTLNFNSDELETILRTHEDDEFEIERLTDIDGNEIEPIQLNRCLLSNRDLPSVGTSHNLDNTFNSIEYYWGDQPEWAIPTVFDEQGFDRHVEVTDFIRTGNAVQPLFFFDDIEENPIAVNTKLSIYISLTMKVIHYSRDEYDNIQDCTGVKSIGIIRFFKYSGNGNYSNYNDVIPDIQLGAWEHQQTNQYIGTTVVEDIPNDVGAAIIFDTPNANWPLNADTVYWSWNVSELNIRLEETTEYTTQFPQPHYFAFVNEVGERLMEIISGKRAKFYSKLFGRHIETRPSPGSSAPLQYQWYDYTEDGEAAYVGLMHGLAVRRFEDTNTQLYKPLTTSMKKLLESCQSVFNIGVGVEPSPYGQRLRVEKLEHFYRPEIKIILPNQITKVTREVDKSMFYSALAFGCDKGGDYEDRFGLDEPNVRTDYTTPIRKSKNKYEKISHYRSDEYGLELIRRKPYWLDETEDTAEDEHIWWLDFKFNVDWVFTQLQWDDVLDQLPFGISSPATYHNWRFTPKRCLLRHGWVIRAGLEHYINMSKPISISSHKGNINLATRYIDENYVAESIDELVSTLDRAIILPEIIKFEHKVDVALYDLIMGTTTVWINGEPEQVPNWYFKFQWVNENEEIETGYLKSFKPKGDTFEFWKANNNKLY